ncbi:MAG: AraC family transcriptional regulator, partial [Flavobacteriales bacterium]|nr:AraC family transcriptional regulator [Flavobacteriales bacterium]
MQEYDIRSVPVKGMIEQLAEDFKTDFLVRLGEYSIQLPESIGNGFISGINFPNGVGLISYDCTFLEDTVFDFTADQIHPLKFLFCSEGAFEFRVPDSNEMNTIFSSQHIIAASSLKNSHRLIFKKGRTTNICSIEIDRIQYLEQLEF